MKTRTKPFKDKKEVGLYRWNGLVIKRQENNLWGVWINYKSKLTSDIKTLNECMQVIDLYWKRKTKTHLRLVK